MRIGILGAGQLGRMLALAGYPLNQDFVFLDPAASACAAPLGQHLHADYSDTHALAEFCARIDIATYEFENVPIAAAEFVAQRVPLMPGAQALAACQDRLIEKQLFDQLGIPVPAYAAVSSLEQLQRAVEQIGLPCVLKTRRFGYDGKGQAVLREAEDIAAAWERLGEHELILEAFVAFERELSIIAVRGQDGLCAYYPVVENQHQQGILRSSIPQADDPMQALAEQHIGKALSHLDYVGIMAFEFFVLDGTLYANEIAPRVHNSGHWSIEGAECSQFENHLRAVAGLPLGSTALRGHSCMLNCIGVAPDTAALAAIPGLHVHHYGKRAKPQRKVGHLTITADSGEQLHQRVTAARQLLGAADS